MIKQYGGVIRPNTKQCLTIPIAPEAEGKRAYELERPDRPTRPARYAAIGL